MKAEKLTIFRRGAGSVAFRDPLSNHIVPFLFGLPVEKTNDDHGHVIATDTAGFTV